MCPHCKNKDCFVDRHHTYWPRSKYKTSLERKFRGLHIVKLWRCEHNEIHATQKPPPKPSRNKMLEAVNEKR